MSPSAGTQSKAPSTPNHTKHPNTQTHRLVASQVVLRRQAVRSKQHYASNTHQQQQLLLAEQIYNTAVYKHQAAAAAIAPVSGECSSRSSSVRAPQQVGAQ